MEKNVCFLDIA